MQKAESRRQLFKKRAGHIDIASLHDKAFQQIQG
jgi:hypothetical protein